MLKKSKSGQAADSGRRYIYARQLSFLQTAGATTETHSSLNDEQEDLDQSQQAPSDLEGTETPPLYTQNSTRKRKGADLETSLIDFINAPIPSSTIPSAIPETNPDRSFFESILPSINNFTEDQKLEFRCEVLNIIKRMRNPPPPQNYEYPKVPYYKSMNVPGPLYPVPYLNRPQFQQSATHFPIHLSSTPSPQSQNPSMNFNPISPSSSSSMTTDNQAFTEGDSLDIFRDGI